MPTWKLALELDANRNTIAGDPQFLSDAIRSGANLRIGTRFGYNEHLDVDSEFSERVTEVAEFGVTHLIEDRWTAGIMSLRQPVDPPKGFGPPPSMSYFLYNQNGQQAIARPILECPVKTGTRGPCTPVVPERMPKYHAQGGWDGDTNAPSHNFIYDFDHYRFYVGGGWQEVFHHDATGKVVSGSLDALIGAFTVGCEIKVAVRNLCSDLLPADAGALEHETFVQTGSGYYNEERRFFSAGTHPVVRVKPAIPMLYESEGWDFGWLLVRTDGNVTYRRCDPYSLKFNDTESQHAIRWFMR